MNNYRVLMSDFVNGEKFNFACFYKASSRRVAGILAFGEFGYGVVIEAITG